MAGFLPKDFVETEEGLIFAVVAAGEEERRVLSFLRYQRSSSGSRKLSTRNAGKLLKQRWPAYLYYSKERDVQLHGIPRDRIVHHHQPRQRLRAIRNSHSDDRLELKLLRLIEQFEAHGVATQDIGVTGSLLIGAQNTYSDIDLVFYRRDTFFKAREVIQQLLAKGVLQPLDNALWHDAHERRGCSLTFDEYLWHEQRKYNKAAIQQTKFDISLVLPDQRPDAVRYNKQGNIFLQSRITDDRHSFDYPARYRLDHPSIEEVVSYTATYAGQAHTGETVAVRGQLEISATGHQRIIVGTDREASGEYIKVLPPE